MSAQRQETAAVSDARPGLVVGARIRRDHRSAVRSDCHRQAWITTAEAELISGLDRRWIRQLCHAGKIAARPRGAYRIDASSLQAYLSGDGTK